MATIEIYSNLIENCDLEAQKDSHIENLKHDLSLADNEKEINYLKACISLAMDSDIEDYYQEAQDYLNLTFSDELENLNKTLDNKILCIADLGLWNGRRKGYKIMNNNLNEILSARTRDSDIYRVFVDTKTKQVKSEDTHHDGTNMYLFREIRPNRDINVLLDKIYNGDEITQQMINYYTKSIYNHIKEIYGF